MIPGFTGLPAATAPRLVDADVHVDSLFSGRYQVASSRKECDSLKSGELLKRDGGGDRTRTCKPLRAAVFKTAALPIMLPLRFERACSI